MPNVINPGDYEGQVLSDSVQIPVGFTGRVEVFITLQRNNEYDDPAKSLDFTIQNSTDDLEWHNVARTQWEGGPDQVDKFGAPRPDPRISVGILPEHADTFWRVKLDIPTGEPLRLAARVDAQP